MPPSHGEERQSDETPGGLRGFRVYDGNHHCDRCERANDNPYADFNGTVRECADHCALWPKQLAWICPGGRPDSPLRTGLADSLSAGHPNGVHGPSSPDGPARKSLITAARQDGLSIDELRELSTMVQEPPSGVIGLTRALIALTVLTGVGMALVLTLISNAADAIDLRKTIVTSLLSILATIAGFYFGSRTSQDATNAATAASSPPPPPSNGGNGTTTGRTTTTGTTTDKPRTLPAPCMRVA